MTYLDIPLRLSQAQLLRQRLLWVSVLMALWRHRYRHYT